MAISIKLNPRLQPLLYKMKYLSKGIINNHCFIDENRNSSKFLFIVGCGRSGNTLLRRLIMETFDIYIPPETYVLPRQIKHYGLNPNFTWPEKVDLIISILENHPEFDTFGVKSFTDFKSLAKSWPVKSQTFIFLMDSLYRRIGLENKISGKWVGDKTPLNTLGLGFIHWAFPYAHFIYIERDPVDVCQSYVKAGLYDSLDKAAMRWRDSLKAWTQFKRMKSPDQIFEIRYEDLVSNPSAVIRELGEKFNIPKRTYKLVLDQSMLGDVGARIHHSNVQNEPSPKSIGKGREISTASDLREIQKIIGHLAIKRGYSKIT